MTGGLQGSIESFARSRKPYGRAVHKHLVKNCFLLFFIVFKWFKLVFKVGFFEAGHPLFVRVLYLRVTATSSAHRTVKNRISPERSLFMESVKI